MKILASTLVTFALVSGAAIAQQPHDHATHGEAMQTDQAPAKEQQRIGDPYPLDTCIVAGAKLGSMGDPIIMLHEGREVRFCCQGCEGAFEADPAKYLAKADETITEQQKRFYPLSYCIIDTDEAISKDESKNAYSVVGNRLFVYCCPPCDPKVRAEPAKYIEILDQAVIKQQAESYPLDTCVISGQPLDSMGGVVSMVVANQLIQLCCAGCKGQVEANPSGTLAKIQAARQDSKEKSTN